MIKIKYNLLKFIIIINLFYFCNLTQIYSLSFNSVKYIKTDSIIFDFLKYKNIIYVLTHNGLLLYDINGNLIKYINKKNGLPSNLLQEILFISKNEYWIASLEGVIHFKLNKFKLYTKENGLNDNRVYCIKKDKNNIIYVGTQRGVNKFLNNKFIPFNDSHEFSRKPTYDILIASDNTIWFAKNNGLTHFIKKNKWEIYTNDYVENDMVLPSNNILCLTEDFNKNIWVGTKDGLVLIVNNRIKKNYYYSDLGIYDNQLKNKRINSINSDLKGNLWISYGFASNDFNCKGITNYNLRNNSWNHITKINDFKLDVIQKIKCSNNGEILISTIKEIIIVSCHCEGGTTEAISDTKERDCHANFVGSQ